MLNITDSFEETIVLSKTRKPAGSRVAAINSAVPPHTEIHAPYRTPWPSLREGEGKKTRGVCLDSGLSSSFSRRKITVRLATRGSSTLTAIAVVVFKRSSAETVRNPRGTPRRPWGEKKKEKRPWADSTPPEVALTRHLPFLRETNVFLVILVRLIESLVNDLEAITSDFCASMTIFEVEKKKNQTRYSIF